MSDDTVTVEVRVRTPYRLATVRVRPGDVVLLPRDQAAIFAAAGIVELDKKVKRRLTDTEKAKAAGGAP